MDTNIVEFTCLVFKKDVSVLTEDDKKLINQSVTTKRYAQSYCENTIDHLERFELLGDKLIAFVFTKFCFSKEPFNKLLHIEGGERIVTRLVIKYLSTPWMSEMCRFTNLFKYIKRHENEPKSHDIVMEDVLESWLGLCSLIFKYEEVEQVLFDMFYKLELDLSFESLYDAKTRFNDFVNKMNGNRSNYNTEQINQIDGSESYYKTEAHVTTIAYVGIGIGKTEKQSQDAAAKDWLRWYSEKYPSSYWKIYTSIGPRITWRAIYGQYDKDYTSPNSSPRRASKRSSIDDKLTKVSKKLKSEIDRGKKDYSRSRLRKKQ